MRRLALALLSLVSCASWLDSNPNPWLTPEQTWDDASEERAAIACAAARLYPEIAERFKRVRVVTRVDYPFRGYTDARAIGLRGNRDQFPTARVSAWRHEAVHWLEWARTDKWTAYPECAREPFLSREREFKAAYGACRNPGATDLPNEVQP